MASQNSSEYETYVVIADFNGTADNELSIKMGEELLVLQSTPEGWSEGYTQDGRQGWFPSAYARFDPVGRNDVMEQIKEASKISEASLTTQSSQPSISVQSAAKTNQPRPPKPVKKKTKVKEAEAANPFPGIRRHVMDEPAGAPGGGSSPFPGIRHHIPEGHSPFPGIRHHDTPSRDGSKKDDKKKKAEEKKKEKERKKKERELKKDLLLASSGLFGVPLKASVAQEQPETKIPFIVRCCIAHILTGKNLLREGLFRISGVKTEIDQLKSSFESGIESEAQNAVDNADIDAVAGVLKQYFRELPDPLFANKCYSKFLKAATDKNAGTLEFIFKELPLGHKETLIFVLGFLQKVTEYQDQNKMTETNIGIVFAPTLMKPPTDDEHDEPEQLKEAFFFILRNSNMFLKSEPKIDGLLQSMIAKCTIGNAGEEAGGGGDSSSSSSSAPSLAPPPARVSLNSSSGGMMAPPPALVPPSVKNSPLPPAVKNSPSPGTPSQGPLVPANLPPPIGALPPPMFN
mmetsp:Transcript_11926/g.15849  ORF Transcript_11926/g.15849 Transcript_11926/m.15849 type:complete len:516 (-) Transcript_11926:458-2005(-)|eukprot:CAMPEP_0201491672 /NCGR_PEP_ID=MMETSP0151_2-20130828/30743_1 /ASSEMBLY_ACC=CAM_ASM_000257 /TAXON_ID=200890 /ORGANISM="Paramoeba atlantica, Strain 621/1 / CCAP 1560/9" /LENGTH=515 /DNA_ID=CAMNT_0047878143 /DNA_START=136 /DNA_END=1683 /DNA_ORIENTATION=+